MGNRTSRHLNPGQHDLRGKKTAVICPCCASMINHKEDILRKIHVDEMIDAFESNPTDVGSKA